MTHPIRNPAAKATEPIVRHVILCDGGGRCGLRPRQSSARWHSQWIPLRRTAYLLCGDWYLADDLAQTALIKLYRSWNKVDRHEAVASWLRKTVVRSYLDYCRKPWRREWPTDVVPEQVVFDNNDSEVPQLLLASLTRVPARQRACLVLRCYDDLSVAATADALGCSQGTVKSQTAKGLANLRAVLAPKQAPTSELDDVR